MDIYYEGAIKYVRADDVGVSYTDAHYIFSQMFPQYVRTFRHFESEITEGLNEYISDYEGMVESLTTKEKTGYYVLFKLAFYLFSEFELGRRRVFKKQHTNNDWLVKKEKYNNSCAYCGISGKLEKDHIVPISRGGEDKIDNIVPACPSCNRKKYNKLLTVTELQALQRSIYG